MKSLITMVLGIASALASGVLSAQNGDMMNGGSSSMGGYGGYWVPVMLVVVVGIVVWAVLKRRK